MGTLGLYGIRELSECCGQERWEDNKEEDGECLHAGSMEETTQEHSRAQAMSCVSGNVLLLRNRRAWGLGVGVNIWKVDKAQNRSSEGTLGDRSTGQRGQKS